VKDADFDRVILGKGTGGKRERYGRCRKSRPSGVASKDH